MFFSGHPRRGPKPKTRHTGMSLELLTHQTHADPMNRRMFVKAGAISSAFAAAPELWLRSAQAASEQAYERLDKARFQKLADLAMSTAKRLGASYADLRVCREESEDLNT